MSSGAAAWKVFHRGQDLWFGMSYRTQPLAHADRRVSYYAVPPRARYETCELEAPEKVSAAPRRASLLYGIVGCEDSLIWTGNTFATAYASDAMEARGPWAVLP